MNTILGRPKTKARLSCRTLFPRIVVLLSFWCAVASADATQSVTLAWDPSPDASVAGYYLRYGTTSRTYTQVIDTGSATTGTIDGLVVGQTYYIVVTAYTVQRLESEPSGEIAYTVPAPAPEVPVPGGLRMVRGEPPDALPRLQFLVAPARAYEVQASEDSRSWKKIHTSVSLSTNWIDFVDPQAATLPNRFYRLALPEGPDIPGTISLLRGRAPEGSVCLRPQVAQGQRYQIQASQDLVTWTTLHDAVCTAGLPLDFIDVEAAAYSRRFYRLAFPDTPLALNSLQIVRGGISDGSRLRIAALEGQHYRVEASRDTKTWRTIYEGISISNEPVELIDPRAGSLQKRFYRLAFD